MTHVFRLYVAGESPSSSRAAANLTALCHEVLPGCHSVEVIDVLQHPDLAEEASVLATPLAIRVEPRPVRRAVGDFSDLHRLAAALDLPAPAADPSEAP